MIDYERGDFITSLGEWIHPLDSGLRRKDTEGGSAVLLTSSRF